MKKILSILICLSMLLLCVPNVLAEDALATIIFEDDFDEIPSQSGEPTDAEITAYLTSQGTEGDPAYVTVDENSKISFSKTTGTGDTGGALGFTCSWAGAKYNQLVTKSYPAPQSSGEMLYGSMKIRLDSGTLNKLFITDAANPTDQSRFASSEGKWGAYYTYDTSAVNTTDWYTFVFEWAYRNDTYTNMTISLYDADGELVDIKGNKHLFEMSNYTACGMAIYWGDPSAFNYSVDDIVFIKATTDTASAALDYILNGTPLTPPEIVSKPLNTNQKLTPELTFELDRAVNAEGLALTLAAMEGDSYGAAETLVSETDYTAALSADGKSLTIKLLTELSAATKYKLNIKGILDTKYPSITEANGYDFEFTTAYVNEVSVSEKVDISVSDSSTTVEAKVTVERINDEDIFPAVIDGVVVAYNADGTMKKLVGYVNNAEVKNNSVSLTFAKPADEDSGCTYKILLMESTSGLFMPIASPITCNFSAE